MTKDEQRFYRRGYGRGHATGIKKAWPDHTPPNPPQEQVAAIFAAAKNLRDAADGILVCIEADDGPDGPFFTLQREANKVDAAFVAISQWLKSAAVDSVALRRDDIHCGGHK